MAFGHVRVTQKTIERSVWTASSRSACEHGRRFGGILCAQASSSLTLVAWLLARDSGTHAVLYSAIPPMVVGHMGLRSAGICPASGCVYCLSSVRCYQNSTRSQPGSYSLSSLPCDCVLTLCCPCSSSRVLCAHDPWRYNSHALQQSICTA